MIITDNETTRAILAKMQEYPGFDQWFDGLEVVDSVSLQNEMDDLLTPASEPNCTCGAQSCPVCTGENR